MAHRGRLNTLVNICSKPMAQLFTQFHPIALEGFGSGDVKYHLGTHSEKLLERWRVLLNIKIPTDTTRYPIVISIFVIFYFIFKMKLCVKNWKKDRNGDKKILIIFTLDIFISTFRTKKKVLLAVMANSSHLEAIDPVIVGRVRAEQVEKGDSARTYHIYECVIFR